MDFEVKTAEGWKKFNGINIVQKDFIYEIRTTLGHKLKCSDNHKLLTFNGWKETSELSEDDFIRTKLGWEKLSYTKKIHEKHSLYDLLNVKDTKSYFTNNILSHNCHFLGSIDTLIEGWKLRELTHIRPIEERDDLRIYEQPIENHIYFLSADVSHGKKMDYHAITVIDITNYPFNVVAVYRNNELSYLVLPDIINRLAIKYNRAYTLIELNDLGVSVADSLYYDLEYENMLAGVPKQGTGQVLSEIDMKYKGISVRKTTKRIGCSNLKTLIEGDKLILNDSDILIETFNFIRKGNSYEADAGYNDDLIMTLVNFAWCVTQEYFKELTNRDIRDIYSERIKQIEEELIPFGFIDDGVNNYDDDDIKF